MRIREMFEDGRIVKGVNTTVDVSTDEIKTQAAKFGNTVSKDGVPPSLASNVKGKSTNVLFNFGLTESKDDPCWKGYKQIGMKKKGNKEVPNCVPVSENEITVDDADEITGFLDEALNEAEYQGRSVKLNKPMQGDVKKFKVYVKNKKGNVIKVNFGDPDMRIKKSNPERRKSFRARHKCDQKKDKTTAGYWSCKKW